MKALERIRLSVEYYLNRLRCAYYRLFHDIEIGNRCSIERGGAITTLYGGKIKIGDCCSISRGAQLLTHGGNISIGNNCTINPMTVIYGQGGVFIGDNVRIAAQCAIIPSNHIFTDATIPIYLQGLSKKGIVIKDDVWLGAGVKVLDGVTIGEGCVIGANSVVTKSLPPYGVYVGVPAKLLKIRNK